MLISYSRDSPSVFSRNRHASSSGCEKSKGKRPRKERGDSSPPSAFLALKWTDRAPKVHDLTNQLYSQADDAYFDEAGQAAVDAMYDAYTKFGVSMTVLGERFKKGSLQETLGLRAELNQVRNDCHKLKQDLHRVQSDLSLASTKHREAIEAKEAEIANEKKMHKYAFTFSSYLQRKLNATEQELVEARDQVSASDGRNMLSQEEVIEAWKQTQAYEDFKISNGIEAFDCGLNDAVDNMKKAFSATGLEDSWPLVKAKYDELEAEANQMVMQGLQTGSSSTAST
ncbi:uncharacterized protein LOC110714495 isoform X2 [Chenopodium quinoa]|uniref:uncharacterized protein LOC110714495 isoform X2 n=1 Tax=Chenopodium quinoa TaxID=63459 RepID=UPI000B7731B1|nr:uncharacterized protein LOC110714495 isoform X2 [Chenopodium quinoa]